MTRYTIHVQGHDTPHVIVARDLPAAKRKLRAMLGVKALPPGCYIESAPYEHEES